jgi:hypothetical protein
MSPSILSIVYILVSSLLLISTETPLPYIMLEASPWAK